MLVKVVFGWLNNALPQVLHCIWVLPVCFWGASYSMATLSVPPRTHSILPPPPPPAHRQTANPRTFQTSSILHHSHQYRYLQGRVYQGDFFISSSIDLGGGTKGSLSLLSLSLLPHNFCVRGAPSHCLWIGSRTDFPLTDGMDLQGIAHRVGGQPYPPRPPSMERHPHTLPQPSIITLP